MTQSTVSGPRGRLLRNSASSLSEAELLAVLFQRGSHAQSAIALSEMLLHRFGGLRPMLLAEQRQLGALRGIGHARLAILRALPELAKRYFEASLPRGQAIRSPADTEAFLMARLRDFWTTGTGSSCSTSYSAARSTAPASTHVKW